MLVSLDECQGLHPNVVVKDAGSGLASGVTDAWSQAEQRDDQFHAVYLAGGEAAHLERRAYGAITAFYESERRLARGSKAQRDTLLAARECARKYMDERIECYDRLEALRRQMTTLLTLTERGSGHLRNAEEVRIGLVRIGTEMERLGGKRIQKVATYLKNRARGLSLYLDALQQKLDATAKDVGGPDTVAVVVRSYQASLEVAQGGPLWDRSARRAELQAATTALLEKMAQDPSHTLQAIQVVIPLLAARHRASSAIENLNSVLRPYLVVQKHVSQGFLDLFRFYWNTRTREWGRHKGTSAHQLLTGTPVPDWLTLLGYPPGATLAA